MDTKNNQVEKGQPDLSHQTVNNSRRSFARLGVAAPVIMTLASKPVFAVQGLSNMLSTHGSAVGRGNCFYGGFSHGYWRDPKPENDSDQAWLTATGSPASKTGTTGAPVYSSVTIGAAFGVNVHTLPPGINTSMTLLQAVNGDGVDNDFIQIVAGLLNLLYFTNNGGSDKYFLTEEQFWALNDNITTKWRLPQGYSSFAELIERNMHGTPSSSCS